MLQLGGLFANSYNYVQLVYILSNPQLEVTISQLVN